MHISIINFFQIIFKLVIEVILYTIEALNYCIKSSDIFVKNFEYNKNILYAIVFTRNITCLYHIIIGKIFCIK